MVVDQPSGVGIVLPFVLVLSTFFFIFFGGIAYGAVNILREKLSKRKDLHPNVSAGIEFFLGIFGFLGFGHMFIGRKGRGLSLLVGFFIYNLVTALMYLDVPTEMPFFTRFMIPVLSAYWAYKTAIETEKQKPEIGDLGIIRY
jgi:hypothetical protein